ncbi:MAG: ribosome-associated translation inhibitor RaiA [Patescibacteria group bacterium]
MNIIIKAKNLDLTPSIKEYIEIKIGSLNHFLTRFENQGKIKIEVEIARITNHHRHGEIFYAEANLHMPKKILRAEHSDIDIHAAIDKIKDKLHQEIIKYKEIAVDHRAEKTE